ncbi:MAG: PAS domain-containing protein, partial [Hyphomicrobiales bacterium]|nr:PAS domain-containing protein [Hyphomicrobiales bacterium]
MTQNPKPPPALDRSERTGSTGLVLLLTIALVAVPFVLRGLPAPQATHAIVGLLTVLAVVGLLALFSYAVGFLQFAGQAAKNDVTKLVADTDGEGLLVTEGEQRIVYANPAYLALSGVRQGADPAPVVRLFSGAADVSEAVYRLAQAAREGKRASEEIRLSPPLGAAAGVESAAWYRLRVRRLDPAGGRAATLWSVADVTRERARHENAFQELQAAVDYLDHAPAGFFSAEPDGSIGYMNATLAGWLDYDLAQFGAGGLKVTDVVAGSGDALLSAVAGGPGAVRTEQFDIDLKRADGKSFPARLLHRVAFSADGQPGPSRTLVLSRAAGEEKGEDLRAAEVRYARFFNATPMAIASVRADGGVERANAAFARMLPGALKEGPAAGALFAA